MCTKRNRVSTFEKNTYNIKLSIYDEDFFGFVLAAQHIFTFLLVSVSNFFFFLKDHSSYMSSNVVQIRHGTCPTLGVIWPSLLAMNTLLHFTIPTRIISKREMLQELEFIGSSQTNYITSRFLFFFSPLFIYLFINKLCASLGA